METSSMIAPNQSRLAQPSSMPPGSPTSRQAPSTSPHTGRVLPKFLQSLCALALPSATPTPPAAPLLPNFASLQAGSTPLTTSQPAEDSSSAFVKQLKEETHTSPPPPPASASIHGQVCASPLVTGNTALQPGVPTAVSITSPVVCGTDGAPSTPSPPQCSPSVVACSPHMAPLGLHLQPNLAQDSHTLTLPNTSQPLSGVPRYPPIPFAPSILSSPVPSLLAGQVADSSVGTTSLLGLHDPLQRRPLSSSPQASTLVSACPAQPSEPATKEGLSRYSEATERMCGGVGMEMGMCEGKSEGAPQGVITKRKNVRVVERRGKKRRRGEAALSKEGECVGNANPAHTAGVHRCGCCGATLLQCESTDTALAAREEGTGLAYVHTVWVTWLPVRMCVFC